MKKYIALVAMLLMVILANAKVDMADTMRSNGKIYVVVAVIICIFLGLAIYLYSLDKKISKIEKDKE